MPIATAAARTAREVLNPSSLVEWMSIKPIAEPTAAPSAAANTRLRLMATSSRLMLGWSNRMSAPDLVRTRGRRCRLPPPTDASPSRSIIVHPLRLKEFIPVPADRARPAATVRAVAAFTLPRPTSITPDGRTGRQESGRNAIATSSQTEILDIHTQLTASGRPSYRACGRDCLLWDCAQNNPSFPLLRLGLLGLGRCSLRGGVLPTSRGSEMKSPRPVWVTPQGHKLEPVPGDTLPVDLLLSFFSPDYSYSLSPPFFRTLCPLI